MDKLTRKELKTDRFALEVQHSVEYFGEHRQMLLRWGTIAIALVVVIVAVVLYRAHTHTVREDALRSALKIQNARIDPAGNNDFMVTFPTAAARDKAVNKAFTDLTSSYSGTEEGMIAEYYLGTSAADQGNIPAAEKHLKNVTDSSSTYAPLAKLALAQIYAGEGKLADGEKLIQSIIDHPTPLVSKEAATIMLGELIGPTDPQRARKLIEPLRNHPRPSVSKSAVNALSDISK